MDLSILLKFVHVLAAIVGVGANLTYSFWLAYAGREPERIPWTLRGIRRLDNLLATPAYIVLLVTGILMVMAGLYSFQTSWIVVSIALYVGIIVVGLVLYAPALRRQLAEAERDVRSPAYSDAARRSNLFGLVTLAIVIFIVFLMVTKPTLW